MSSKFVPVFLIVMGLILVSCAPAAAPTPTAKPAPAAPAAKPTAAPAAATPKPAAPAATPKPAAGQPKYGGVVTRVMDRDVDHFDVQQGQTAATSVPLFNVYQGLVRLDPIEHQKILPELAEKWEVSPDGKTYTFTLFKGIKWHDGKPFTTEDVKYNLERMHNPKAFKTIAPRAESMLAAMDKAEIAGDNSIKVTTRFPSASFMLNLAAGWVAMQPKHILEVKGDMKRDLVGTGAFRFKDFNPNISLELAKNPDYYIKGRPYLDGIKFYTVKDDATRFSAFRTGQTRITFSGSKGLTKVDADIVRRDMAGKATVYEHDSQNVYVILFNLKRKPWDDARIRRAVDLAFDRQEALKINSVGSITSMYIAPWGPKPDELLKRPGYRQPKDADIAEAKKLMAEAGFPNGLKTTLLTRAGGATERQGVVAKDQLARIGIDVELQLVDTAQVTERFLRRAFDLSDYNFLETTGDPDETLYTYYYTGGSRNYGDFSDKEVDALIEKQAQTLDKAAREAILAQIEKRVNELMPRVILFSDLYMTGAWNEVKNFKPGPGIHPWGKFDFMWLDK
ncbi:MAG: ABC transporter substrate-binding protein [Chloroflexi bacterium]|nr:ABC transporter substrate-binding protein [Chloroflexota bacterium]